MRFAKFLFLVAPDEITDGEHNDSDDPREFFEEAEERMELIGEGIANERYSGDPSCGAEKVEDKKFLPFHTERACYGAGNGAQAEDEPCPEDRCGAMTANLVPRHVNVFILVEARSQPAQESWSQALPYVEADIVAEDSACNADEDDPLDAQVRSFICEKAGEEEGGLTREGKTGAFAEQCSEDSEVTPMRQGVSDELINLLHESSVIGWRGGPQNSIETERRSQKARHPIEI